jgi:hypothetical protein
LKLALKRVRETKIRQGGNVWSSNHNAFDYVDCAWHSHRHLLDNTMFPAFVLTLVRRFNECSHNVFGF